MPLPLHHLGPAYPAVFSAQVITAPGRPETTPLGPAKSVIHASRKDTQNLESGEQDDPGKRQEIQEKRAEVRQAMDELTEQHRNVLEWKYLDKLSVRAIAERWETTEKAVESILFRARREFRMRLLKTDVADELPPSRNGSRKSAPDQSQRTRPTDAVPKKTCSSNDPVT